MVEMADGRVGPPRLGIRRWRLKAQSELVQSYTDDTLSHEVPG